MELDEHSGRRGFAWESGKPGCWEENTSTSRSGRRTVTDDVSMLDFAIPCAAPRQQSVTLRPHPTAPKKDYGLHEFKEEDLIRQTDCVYWARGLVDYWRSSRSWIREERTIWQRRRPYIHPFWRPGWEKVRNCEYWRKAIRFLELEYNTSRLESVQLRR